MKEPIKNETVSESAMTRSIIASVIGIVICLACLFGTTWAWYTSTAVSADNEIVGANFDFSVTVSDNVTPDTDGIYTFTGETHTVTLTRTGNLSEGFCHITATKSGEANGTVYRFDLSGSNNSISFNVTGAGTLKLTPMRGSLTDYENPAAGITLKETASEVQNEQIKGSEKEENTPESAQEGTPEAVQEAAQEGTQEA